MRIPSKRRSPSLSARLTLQRSTPLPPARAPKALRLILRLPTPERDEWEHEYGVGGRRLKALVGKYDFERMHEVAKAKLGRDQAAVVIVTTRSIGNHPQY